jgi:hypothetical protein
MLNDPRLSTGKPGNTVHGDEPDRLPRRTLERPCRWAQPAGDEEDCEGARQQLVMATMTLATPERGPAHGVARARWPASAQDAARASPPEGRAPDLRRAELRRTVRP